MINVKEIVAVAHSQVEMGRTCGKNVPAQIGIGNNSVGRKNRQEENWATGNQMSRHVQESSRRTVVTSRRKLERMGWIHTTFVRMTSLGIDHLEIKHSRTSWFHQETGVLVGLIGFVAVFSYLYI
jgi:hypothetical protein